MEPYSQKEILTAFANLANSGLEFWAKLPPAIFAAPLGTAWSPADNLRHLTKSTRPVAQSLRLPGIAFLAFFGAADQPSLSYAELRERYQAVLAGGASAGRFAPRPAAVPQNVVAWQRQLVEDCATAIGALGRAASRWNEADLDRYRMPHPLLGKLTLREMLFFTHYHFTHHQQNVVRRLASNQ